MPSDSRLLPRRSDPPQDDSRPKAEWLPDRPFPRTCHRIANASWFSWLSTAVIILNAVVIGVGTYPAATVRAGHVLSFLDEACLAYFVVEVAIRFFAYGANPLRFFRNGWNGFDFVVVGAALVPGLRENVTLLRLIRLARTVRLMKFFPSLRILLTAVWRSLPGALGLIGVCVVVLYLYGMLGWILFADAKPVEYGSVGRAVLTLFGLLTLDNVIDVVRDGMRVTAWAVPYYVSYIFFAGFILVNLLIGVVITSMEEARQIEGAGTRFRARKPETPAGSAEILARLAELQRTVDELRRDDGNRN